MSEVEFTSGKRRGRTFTKGSDGVRQGRISFFDDDGDRVRDRMIARLLRRHDIAVATAHPAVGRDDEMHVFFSSPDSRAKLPTIFACTIITRARLQQMLGDGTNVTEGFALQVVDDKDLDRQAIQKAIRQWIGRTYPNHDSDHALKVSIHEDQGRTRPVQSRHRPKFSTPDSRFYSPTRLIPASMVF